MWLDELRDDALARSAVAALIDDRLWPGKLRQRPAILDGAPAMTYQVISRPFNELAHDGDSGLRSPRVQWGCWGKSYDDAWALAEVMESEYHGTSFELDSHEYTVAMVVDERDDYDQDTGLSRVIVDMLLRQKEQE